MILAREEIRHTRMTSFQPTYVIGGDGLPIMLQNSKILLPKLNTCTQHNKDNSYLIYRNDLIRTNTNTKTLLISRNNYSNSNGYDYNRNPKSNKYVTNQTELNNINRNYDKYNKCLRNEEIRRNILNNRKNERTR